MTQNIEASPNVPKWQASGRLPFKQNQLGTLKDDLSMWGKRVGIRETCQCTTKGRFYTTMLVHNQTSKITILPLWQNSCPSASSNPGICDGGVFAPADVLGQFQATSDKESTLAEQNF